MTEEIICYPDLHDLHRNCNENYDIGTLCNLGTSSFGGQCSRLPIDVSEVCLPSYAMMTGLQILWPSACNKLSGIFASPWLQRSGKSISGRQEDRRRKQGWTVIVYVGISLMIESRIAQVLYSVFSGGHPQMPADAPAEYRTLIQDCWTGDAHARPSFDDVIARLMTLLADTQGSRPASAHPAGATSDKARPLR